MVVWGACQRDYRTTNCSSSPLITRMREGGYSLHCAFFFFLTGSLCAELRVLDGVTRSFHTVMGVKLSEYQRKETLLVCSSILLQLQLPTKKKKGGGIHFHAFFFNLRGKSFLWTWCKSYTSYQPHAPTSPQLEKKSVRTHCHVNKNVCPSCVNYVRI